MLTILSPCILLVLRFVFARDDQPFRKSGLPLPAGMAGTFAIVASLAIVGGGWAVRANQFGRIAALVLFGVFASRCVVTEERLYQLIRQGAIQDRMFRIEFLVRGVHAYSSHLGSEI